MITAGQMKWVWSAVFVIVAFFGFGMTQWEIIGHLLENEGGVGDEGASMLAFVAGYTLPLTLGAAVITGIWLSGAFERTSPWAAMIGAAIVFLVSGAIAEELGLGLLPRYDPGLPAIGGHPAIRFLAWVLGGYFNTYGWPLMVCSAAIGFAVAVQIQVWMQNEAGA